MWLDDIDIGGRGICQPATGPLGRAIRAVRHDLYLSQQRLADFAGVSQAAVSRLERGAPAWRLFCTIVDAIGGRPEVTVERLLTDRELLDLIARGENLPPDARPVVADDWW